MHGPTFMGNPLAAAVSRASRRPAARPRVARRRRAAAGPAARRASRRRGGCRGVQDVRVLGGDRRRGDARSRWTCAPPPPFLAERGVWLRPFGRLLYTMPAYVMADEDVDRVTAAMVELAATAPGPDGMSDEPALELRPTPYDSAVVQALEAQVQQHYRRDLRRPRRGRHRHRRVRRTGRGVPGRLGRRRAGGDRRRAAPRRLRGRDQADVRRPVAPRARPRPGAARGARGLRGAARATDTWCWRRGRGSRRRSRCTSRAATGRSRTSATTGTRRCAAASPSRCRGGAG